MAEEGEWVVGGVSKRSVLPREAAWLVQPLVLAHLGDSSNCSNFSSKLIPVLQKKKKAPQMTTNHFCLTRQNKITSLFISLTSSSGMVEQKTMNIY